MAGNISYNLKLLGGEPFPMGAVGDDFGPYQRHFDRLGISTKYVKHMTGEFTPQAFITTDHEDNQITAFHPGAMSQSYLNKVSDTEGIQIGIVAPDGKEAMLQHSVDFPAAGIPHIFDPGQAMILFNGEELRSFIRHADWIVMNDYEYQVLRDRAGMDGDEIARHTRAFVVTIIAYDVLRLMGNEAMASFLLALVAIASLLVTLNAGALIRLMTRKWVFTLAVAALAAAFPRGPG